SPGFDAIQDAQPTPGTSRHMTADFIEQRYGPAIAELLLPERLPELGPGSPNLAAKPALLAVSAPRPCFAGLWLLHDFLDESHTIIDRQSCKFSIFEAFLQSA